MLQFPETSREWLIATVSALTGFFFGGAAIAAVQKLLKRVM